jgi:hypothetical protein
MTGAAGWGQGFTDIDVAISASDPVTITSAPVAERQTFGPRSATARRRWP